MNLHKKTLTKDIRNRESYKIKIYCIHIFHFYSKINFIFRNGTYRFYDHIAQ